MKGVIPYIVAVLIGAGAGHLATPKVLDQHKVVLAKVKSLYNHKLDSMEIVRIVDQKADSSWLTHTKAVHDSLVEERVMKQFWYKETVRLRKIVDSK